jgi:Skp family chaperone for outer membrane proteins
MKKILFSAFLFMGLAAAAQEATEIPAAKKGQTYGVVPESPVAAVSINDVETKVQNGKYSGKVEGRVKEVCQTMGCWMKIEKADGSTVMVKMKDHAFFLPKNIAGHTVQIDGIAEVKTETEAKRKHYAEDAGKSKAEIAKIKGDSRETQILASGVVVID